jgi:hypothetical protein
MAINWQEAALPKSRFGRSKVVGRQLRITRVKAKDDPRSLLEFTVSEALCKELRWRVGDFITLVESPDGSMFGLLRTKQSQGWKLCPKEIGKGLAAKLEGKVANARVRIPVEETVYHKLIAADGTANIIDDPLIDEDVLVIGEPLQ